MKYIIHIKLIITSLILGVNLFSFGQENNVYDEMSLDEILNIDVVVTASKNPKIFLKPHFL